MTALSTGDLIRAALAEDHGSGDVTSRAAIPAAARARAVIRAKAAGVICGLEVARAAFLELDSACVVETAYHDGDHVAPGDIVLRLDGAARAVLGAERVALNFLQHLSGVATLTRRFVDAVEGTGAAILDTRKTTPGMRLLEKAAVRAGGGRNHRIGLFDMVLLKENHLRLAGGVTAAVGAARAEAPGVPVEVETTTLDEAREAVDAGVERLMIDNADPPTLASRVAAIRAYAAGCGVACPRLEMSGGVTLETVRAFAETGVDDISVGALTHSAPALDLSLLVEEVG